MKQDRIKQLVKSIENGEPINQRKFKTGYDYANLKVTLVEYPGLKLSNELMSKLSHKFILRFEHSTESARYNRIIFKDCLTSVEYIVPINYGVRVINDELHIAKKDTEYKKTERLHTYEISSAWNN